MSTTFKKNEIGSNGKDFELPKPGNYAARCIKLIIIGTTNVFFGETVSRKSLIRITYELPTQLEEFKEGEPKQPWVIEVEFTKTTASKGNLIKWLSAWNPEITVENIHELDFADMLGAPALLTVAHNPDKKNPKKVYLKATGISAPIDGMTIPDQMNPSFLFDTEEFDQDKFNTFPPFIRKKILESDEFAALGLSANDCENKASVARNENISESTPSVDEAEKAITEEDNTNAGGEKKVGKFF